MDITNTAQRMAWWALAVLALLGLQGCLATKVVTVPVKVAYGAGKLAVKGTAATVRAIVPDDEEEEDAQPGQDSPKPPPAH